MVSLTTVLPTYAFAHVEQGQATGLISGLQHPWSGLDHVLAMIAVGIWGAQLGNPAIWVLPVTFPMVMALGAMMGLLGFPLPGIEIGIALQGFRVPKDIIVTTPKDFEWRREIIGTIERPAVKEGKILYARE